MKIVYVFVDREFLQGNHVEKMLHGFQANCNKKGYAIKLLVLSECSQGLTKDNLINQYSCDFDGFALTFPIDEIIYTSENLSYLPLHLAGLVKKLRNKSSLDKFFCILDLQNQRHELFSSVAFDRLMYSTRENSAATFQECSGFLASDSSKPCRHRLSVDTSMFGLEPIGDARDTDSDSDESTQDADVCPSSASTRPAITRKLEFSFGAGTVRRAKQTDVFNVSRGPSF